MPSMRSRADVPLPGHAGGFKEMKPLLEKQLREWCKDRPSIILETALKYPPGTRFDIHGTVMHVVSYQEDGGLSVSATDPGEDYEKAVAERTPVCACCIKNIASLQIT